MANAPTAEAKVTMPLSKGLRPKASCSISGNRKGIAPVPSRNTVPPIIVSRNSGCLKSLRSRIGNSVRRKWNQ